MKLAAENLLLPLTLWGTLGFTNGIPRSPPRRYLMCGNCIGSGIDPASRSACTYCAKSGKVMCTGCLCTGKQLATEHDPRIDPFV